MSEPNFPKALTIELREEGGFSNNPADKGGPTNLGVTAATLSDWLGRQATTSEVKGLTEPTVEPIYHARYWLAASCDKLPGGLDLLIFDSAIQHGVGRALRWLQAAADCPVDGKVGPVTLAAVRATPGLVDRYTVMRKAFYMGLNNFDVFGRGWLARLERIRTLAHAWADGATT